MKQGKPCYKHGAVPTLPAPACSNNTPIISCTSFLHDREIHFVCCQPFGLGGRAYRCSCPLLHPYLNTQSQLIIQLIMYGGAAASPAGALSLLLSTTDFHLPLHLLRRHHHGSAQPSGIKVLRCRRRSRVMAGCCGPTEVGRSFGFRAKLQQHARSNRAKQTNGCTSNQQMNLASSLGNHETRSEPNLQCKFLSCGSREPRKAAPVPPQQHGQRSRHLWQPGVARAALDRWSRRCEFAASSEQLPRPRPDGSARCFAKPRTLLQSTACLQIMLLHVCVGYCALQSDRIPEPT